MLIEISADQRDVLAAVIRGELDEMGPEIHHTRTSGYRDELKLRKDLLEQVLDRLSIPEPVGG